MRFESKYSVGDEVTVIRKSQVELPPVRCSACEGEGRCLLRGESFACPKCQGRKVTQAKGYGWVITDRVVVRSVEAQTVRGPDADISYDFEQLRNGVRFRYMSNADGCGSVYREEELWSTRDAQAECDRRNGT